MKRAWLAVLCVAVCLMPLSNSWAAGVNSNAGTSAFPFLKINPGARAVAMGGAFTGLANDEMAVYYNPAGLSLLEGKRFLLEYHSYFADINNGMIAGFWPIAPEKVLAAHISYLNYGDFIQADELGNITGEFGGSDLVFGLSYGMQVARSIAVGATGKFIYENIQEYSASGLAADLGVKWTSDRERYSAGLMIQNLGGQLSGLGDEKDKLPFMVRAGGAIRPRGADLTATLDLGIPVDNDLIVAVGAEFSKLDPVHIRAGWNSFGSNFRSEGSDNGIAGVSLGFGLDLWTTQLSYAFTPAADLGDMHRITWQGRFK